MIEGLKKWTNEGCGTRLLSEKGKGRKQARKNK